MTSTLPSRLTGSPPAAPPDRRAACRAHVVNRTASAPSITRWSYDSESGSIRRGTNAPSSKTGRVGRARHAEDSDLRRVDDRRERSATDAAEARDREAATLHVGGRELAGACLFAQRGELARELEDVLAIGITHDRHDESLRRVGRKAEVHVFLDTSSPASGVERRREMWEGLQRLHAGAHDERERRELDAPCRRFVLQALTRASSIAVMSASSNCVTCGMLTQLACSRGPAIFWMRVRGVARSGRRPQSRPWAHPAARLRPSARAR